jgi:Asp-tRNA(Asn)/Glu-tRNA(Gln) amidotransferase A subunit family amidase
LFDMRELWKRRPAPGISNVTLMDEGMAEARSLERLDATKAASLIAGGRLTSEDLVRAVLCRIASRDADIAAWSHVDADAALAQAQLCDSRPVRGLLHGIPVGIKDIIATADMPTQYNSALYEGFHAGADAACVRLVKLAGGIVLGKNDTVEFAVNGRRAATRNPHDLTRTPGGSSSGSAAAVADFQVPLSIGTQTGGSVIRPASYCGIFAIKPTWHAASHEGFKFCAPSIDTLGWYGRSAADVRLLAEVLGIAPAAVQEHLRGKRFAICRTPVWEHAEPSTRMAMQTAAKRLAAAGAEVIELTLPAAFAGLTEAHKVIMQSEMRASFRADFVEFGTQLYPELVDTMNNKNGHTRQDLVAAYDLAARCRAEFDALAEPFDGVLTPSATGEAPFGPDNTGQAVFNRIWTVLHVPVVNIPGLTGENGLPVGLSLTGPRFSDGRLLGLAGAVGNVFKA